MLEQKREAAEHRFGRLRPPLNKAHLPFDFDFFIFFFAIALLLELPSPTQNNVALQMNTA